jgi:plasmid stability protein
MIAHVSEVGAMASLIVRRVEDDLVRRLKERAAANGRSAEAEHRAILAAALKPVMTGAELWDELARFGPLEIDFEMPDLDQTPDAADFS